MGKARRTRRRWDIQQGRKLRRRGVCPCGDPRIEDPGPHLATCPWGDDVRAACESHILTGRGEVSVPADMPLREYAPFWGVLDLCDAWTAEGARVILLRDGREVQS